MARREPREADRLSRGPATRLDVGPRLTSAWLVLGVMIATMGGFLGSTMFSHHIAAKLDADAVSIATNASPSIEHLSAARRALFQLLLASDSAIQRSSLGVPLERSAFAEELGRLHGQISAYLTLPFYPGERDHFSDVELATRDLELRLSEIMDRLAVSDVQGAAASRTRLVEAASRDDSALGYLVAFNAEQQHRLALDIPRQRLRGIRVGYLLEGATAVFGLVLMGLVVRAIRQYARLLRSRSALAAESARDIAAFGTKLESIIGSSVKISGAITTVEDPHRVFQIIADEARVVVKAQYCAVGCGTDPSRPFDPWVSSGIFPATAAALGGPPRPDGILGAVIRERRAIRVATLTDHPAYHGLPAGHPPLGPFLGLPIFHDESNVGNLYLARRPGQSPFTQEDERAAALLASYVGVAIENAALYGAAVAATRAREDLLATVSHDLKNPLNTIRLTSASLRPLAGDGKAGNFVARIDRATDRMMSLINDLLDAAKIEAGLFHATCQPEDIGSLLESAVEMCRAAAAEKVLALVPRGPPLPAKVPCDRALLLRVLGNLISNAIQFGPSGSSIVVAAEEEPERFCFSVSDAGPGIPAEYLPHVFDRYWQRQGTDRRRGSGLGLYIAKGIMDAHGGRIWIDSAPGRGTTIHFALPTLRGRGEPLPPSP